MYKAGSTISVKAVAEKIPPITTVASGRCTSAPCDVASAIGKNPKAARKDAINTGRKMALVP